MSIWDDYKTRVRTRINVKQDRLLQTYTANGVISMAAINGRN